MKIRHLPANVLSALWLLFLIHVPTALAQTQTAATANWVDGLGGGRIELALTPKLSAMVMGDAGGGSAKLDYQVAGLLGYQLSRKLILLERGIATSRWTIARLGTPVSFTTLPCPAWCSV